MYIKKIVPMNNSVTLDDLPIVPTNFCKNCPEEHRNACLQCLETTKHVAMNTTTEYGIQANTEYHGENAKKCCAIDLKKNTAK